MQSFLKTANNFRPHDSREGEIINSLPPDIYILMIDNQGFYLKRHDQFKLPTKLYGDTEKRASRIMYTFEDRSTNTGVLLSGEKGSGKTLLAKTLAQKGLDRGYSTIIVNSPYSGDAFDEVMQKIEVPCIVMFDEFEKVYGDKQDQMLTFMDGTSTHKKLLILTCNNKWQIDQHMLNRPGRLFYHYSYRGLTPEFIREYCEDHLQNKFHTDAVVLVGGLFDNFNFDGLQSVVEECNRYGESPEEVLAHINLKPFDENNALRWMVEATYENGKPCSAAYETPRLDDVSTSPLNGETIVYMDKKTKARAGIKKRGYSMGDAQSDDDLEVDDSEYDCSFELTPETFLKSDPDGSLSYLVRGFIFHVWKEQPASYKKLYRAY